MARRLFVACVVLLGGAVASCSDATAPMGVLLIAVSPDTVRIGQAVVPPFIKYRERFVSPGQSKIWIAVPQVEVEVTPGKWTSQRDPNNLYLQPALGDPSTVVMEGNLSGEQSLFLRLVAGRYRIRQSYRVSARSATQPAGEVLVATSNPFVVAP